MPYRPDGDFLQDEALSQWDDEQSREPEGAAWWKWAIAIASLAIFGGVIWYAYKSGATGPIGPVRTVEADTSPYKVKPANPGGEIIPDQDKLVFNEAVGRPETSEDILGKEAEAPQSRPEPVMVRPYVPPAPPPKPTPPAVVTPAQPQTAPSQQAALPPAATIAPAPRQATPVAGQVAANVAPPAAKTVPPGAPQSATVPPKAAAASTPPAAAKPALPTAEQKAAPVAGGKGAVVQLGAYASFDGAMESWAEVKRKHDALVGALSPQVVKITVPGKGDLYRLVVGPFASKGDASQTCGQLKAQGRDCIVNVN